ncbi:MAG: hypothetical protein IKO62_01905 [Bacteroidales bacterium]|mgnify:CR=1 FL=1|jgi:hypothetical protein|nr:hypothetical protein [Bacteroidales bacterium]MBR4535392.1 hypothetical protein [Bacteroidales bacterium]
MGNFVDKLRKDSMPMGLFIGFICPAICFGLLYAIITLVQHQTGALNMDRMIQKLILLSVIPNVLLLRYYLVKLKYDLTGRGILLVTFAIAMLFAVLEIAL